MREQAHRFVEMGAYDDARALWLQELAANPGSGDAMVELSYVESHAGRYREALRWAESASRALPVTDEGKFDLIRRLRTFNLTQALHALGLALAAPSAGTSPEVLVECARCLSLAGDFAVARVCIDAALRADRDSGAALALHGQLLVQEGAQQEAQSIFEQLLARDPLNAQVWWRLARLGRQTRTHNHIATMLGVLPALKAVPEQVALLARAIHQEADAIDDVELAWSALELMCRAKRKIEPYDAAQEQQLFRELRALPVARPASVNEQEQPVPIFIVGMHRSGTTLLEQMLAASPELIALGELSDFPAALRYVADSHGRDIVDTQLLGRLEVNDIPAIGEAYLRGLEWRLSKFRFFTDKQPGNYKAIGLICQALPQARILHMVRHPMEVCFSNLREIFNGINAFSYDQVELAKHYLEYRKLMAHWHRAFPGRILDVDYSGLVASPADSMRRISEFCGLKYIPEMTDPRNSRRATVATASTVQVRERVIARSAPKWKRYERHLQALMDTLRAGGGAVGE